MKKNSIFHAGPPIEWKRMTGPIRRGIVATTIEGLAVICNNYFQQTSVEGLIQSSEFRVYSVDFG